MRMWLALTALLVTAPALADDWDKLKVQVGPLDDDLDLQGQLPGFERDVDGGELSAYGETLEVASSRGKWRYRVGRKQSKWIRRWPVVVKLGRGKDARAILLTLQADRVVWTPHWGASFKLGKQTWHMVDADADGKLWGPGDALVAPTAHTVAPFTGQAWSASMAWDLKSDEYGVHVKPAQLPRSKATHELSQAWLTFNALRQQAGLRPVAWDEASARGCRAHAEYCARNKVRTMGEDEDKPGYSEAGDAAGRNASISGAWETPREAILEMFGTAYILACALKPDLGKCGLALRSGVFVCNVNGDRSGTARERPVQWVWPPHGSEDCARAFNCHGEVPIPVPGSEFEHLKRIGACVLARVDPEGKGFSLELKTARGEAVKGTLTYPGKAPRGGPVGEENNGLVIFAPDTALAPATTYLATLRYARGSEQTVERTWRFTTGQRKHLVTCPMCAGAGAR